MRVLEDDYGSAVGDLRLSRMATLFFQRHGRHALFIGWAYVEPVLDVDLWPWPRGDTVTITDITPRAIDVGAREQRQHEHEQRQRRARRASHLRREARRYQPTLEPLT